MLVFRDLFLSNKKKRVWKYSEDRKNYEMIRTGIMYIIMYFTLDGNDEIMTPIEFMDFYDFGS